ncbi:hypothetical protein [Bacillus sp. OTU530]|uniref:hypothetical protein n=1 Tax=Bacillus sp. OTU530 TaxID=3043862 RepID=UPI00313BBC2E
MLKKFFSFSNPVGLIVSSAVLILTVSPEARKGTRKLLVKGAGAAIALGDQMKGLTTGLQQQLGTFVEEAKAERKTMMLPDMTQMVKKGGNMVKHSFEEGVAKTEQVMDTAKDSVRGLFDDETVNYSFEERDTKKLAMETPKEAVATGLFDDIEPAPNQEFTAYNVLDDHSIQMKLHEIEQKLY